MTHLKLDSFNRRKKHTRTPQVMCTPADTSQTRMFANRYLQVKKLGQGSFGTVYLVHDTKSKHER